MSDQNKNRAELVSALYADAGNIRRGTSYQLGTAGYLLLAATEIEAMQDELSLLRGETARLRAEVPAAAPGDAIVGPVDKPGKCRHDWDKSKTPWVCIVCGKPKSNNGRKSADAQPLAAVGAVVKIDPPSQSLPMASAADNFVDGNQGSSGRSARK